MARAGAEAEATADPTDLGWRERALSRSLNAARSRAEERVQRFLDAAFELVDEKGSTEFTIQEVIDRSKQSLRGFYEYFEGKDELLLAMFEETFREACDDIRATVDVESDPLARLHAFTIRLHEWSDPSETPVTLSVQNRRVISEFSMQLAVNHAERVREALTPLTHLLRELIEAAAQAGAIRVANTRVSASIVLQTVMCSWYGNRLIDNPKLRLTAEQTWDFCLHGLGA